MGETVRCGWIGPDGTSCGLDYGHRGCHDMKRGPQKWRANYVPAPHFFNLNHACTIINKAFGAFGCYLVGSSIERRDYRDVDVRFVMEDAAYDRLFQPEGLGHGYVNPMWSLLCQALSLWLSQQSGLPVDFQIQRHTQANEKHPGKRQPLGIFLDYPGERPSDIASATPDDEGLSSMREENDI